MTAPPAADRGLSRAGYPKGGRPPKIKNRARWGLYVNADHRRRAEERATRKGHGDLPDVVRALMAAYAAGKADHLLTAPTEES
jgi:hypothetical protein